MMAPQPASIAARRIGIQSEMGSTIGLGKSRFHNQRLTYVAVKHGASVPTYDVQAVKRRLLLAEDTIQNRRF